MKQQQRRRQKKQEKKTHHQKSRLALLTGNKQSAGGDVCEAQVDTKSTAKERRNNPELEGGSPGAGVVSGRADHVTRRWAERNRRRPGGIREVALINKRPQGKEVLDICSVKGNYLYLK